jgi:transcriptional regulator GlxA family with amidase domain
LARFDRIGLIAPTTSKLRLDIDGHQSDFRQKRSFRARSWNMPRVSAEATDALVLALPETAGSALCGMVDVLAATGTLWQELVGEEPGHPLIRPRIVSPGRRPFRCGNGIPVNPHVTIEEARNPAIVIVPELWLAPTDDMRDRYESVKDWLRRCHRSGSSIYSACSGSVLLAAAGLLDGREATSHWGYTDLFRGSFPKVKFNPAPNLVIADRIGRIVTAGGTTSWHDLAIHIISRHCSPGEALRIAKVYLLKWHGEGQLPYASLVRRQPHADSAVRRAETWLADNFRMPHAVAAVVRHCGIPERSLKRRFTMATGSTLITYVQNLRIEEAKRMLEGGDRAAEDIAALVGYENPAFFRPLFKRATGLTPGAYRRMFQPLNATSRQPGDSPIGLAGRT